MYVHEHHFQGRRIPSQASYGLVSLSVRRLDSNVFSGGLVEVMMLENEGE